MKRIAYIELDTHAEIAGNFMELMQGSPEFAVDYYFSEKIFQRLDRPEGTSIHIVKPRELLKALESLPYDFVLVGTVHRYFNIFEQVVQKNPAYIIGHNLNFIRISPLKLLLKLWDRDRVYRLKLLLKEGLLRKNKVFKKASNILVLDPEMCETSGNAGYLYLPLFYTEFHPETSNSELQVSSLVIPGVVDFTKRDYPGFFEKLRKFKYAWRVVLLGQCPEKSLQQIDAEKRKLPEQIQVVTFMRRVPQAQFEAEMKAASVICAPMRGETRFMGVKELYGKTKMPGSIGDAIRFGKTLVLPEDIQVRNSFCEGEKSDLEPQLIALAQERKDFSAYEKMNVQSRLWQFLSNL